MRVKIAEVAFATKGWSMRQLAETMDVDHQTVMYWNQGRTHPRLPTLVELCRLLGCSFQDLIEI